MNRLQIFICNKKIGLQNEMKKNVAWRVNYTKTKYCVNLNLRTASWMKMWNYVRKKGRMKNQTIRQCLRRGRRIKSGKHFLDSMHFSELTWCDPFLWLIFFIVYCHYKLDKYHRVARPPRLNCNARQSTHWQSTI